MERWKERYKRLLEIVIVFSFCGILYISLELLFRGRTDITMFGLAGFVGLVFAGLNNEFSFDMPFELQVVICTITATLGEWVTGIIFNGDYTIWDYRHLFGTFANGQCNIFFCLLWMMIAIGGIPILDYIEWKVFKCSDKPYYIIFGHKKYLY